MRTMAPRWHLRRSAYPDHPGAWNIRCDYQLARLRADPAALALYRFILGDVGQGYLRQAGFMPFSDAA